MGRKALIKKEPSSSLSCYLLDSLLLDDFKLSSECKADALRRVFTTFFGEEKIKAKWKEIQKKADRQAVILGKRGDQSTIDTVYFPNKSYKDMEFSRQELMEMRIQSSSMDAKNPLAKRNADDSINKAIQRGDCIRAESGNYIIVRKWF